LSPPRKTALLQFPVNQNKGGLIIDESMVRKIVVPDEPKKGGKHGERDIF
jgi:hypothetical protein